MKKVALISLDALSDTEFERLKNYKNFKRFFDKGTYSKKSISVYPTQTYTVHTSVITGSYPDKHGVYNNRYFQPFVEDENKAWFWYRNQVKADTLYDAVRRSEGRVCSILWPVTGKAKIKYNIPEIVAINNENQAFKVMKNSSVFFAFKNEMKHGKMRNGIQQPNLDEFAKSCAVDAVKKHKPDLLMVHLVCVDAAKHNYGVESPKVDEAIGHLDRMIGEIIDACEDEYTIIMFSDHGQFTIKKIVYINAFLEQHGLVDFENKEYDAYIQSMCGSAIIRYNDEKSLEKTLELLKKNKDMLGIEDIYKREMLDELHMEKDIEYVLEAKTGYYFKEEKNDKVIRNLKDENIAYATHGYSPLKDNYKCVFFAMGEGIKQDFEVEHMEVVDIAPTVAKIMGIDEFECDGNALLDIFE